MTAAPDSRRWVAAGVAAILAVFAVDRLTSANVALVTLTAAGPLIAALGGSRRATTRRRGARGRGRAAWSCCSPARSGCRTASAC